MESDLDMLSKFGDPESQDLDKSALESFIKTGAYQNKRIVLVTCGGTSVPLERNAVRSIENFSTGRRGAISTEYFLRIGYFVIYLHREGCVLPFLRTLKGHLENELSGNLFKASNDTLVLKDKIPKNFEKAFFERKKFEDNIFMIPYTTLSQYMHSLYTVCSSLKCLNRKAILYLAAAVSDYFIPENDIPTHKIQSSSQNLVLNLQPVPKIVTRVVESWVPDAFVVTFKLETDTEVLEQKARNALKKYKHHAVVANLLHSRYTSVEIFTMSEKICIDVTKEEIENGAEIEEKIVENLVSFHRSFIEQ